MIDDLWEDYVFFKEKALVTSVDTDLALYKRYVRASLLALFNYFQGVISKWVVSLDPSQHLRRLRAWQMLKIVKRALRDKLKSCPPPSPPGLHLKKTQILRNMLSHLSPAHDEHAIFMHLTDPELFQDAERIVLWIETTKGILGLESHIDMQKLVEDFVAKPRAHHDP